MSFGIFDVNIGCHPSLPWSDMTGIGKIVQVQGLPLRSEGKRVILLQYQMLTAQWSVLMTGIAYLLY